jgi:hypothetical protein
MFVEKSSCFAAALGVSKITKIFAMNWVTLCWPAQVRLGCLTNPPQG